MTTRQPLVTALLISTLLASTASIAQEENLLLTCSEKRVEIVKNGEPKEGRHIGTKPELLEFYLISKRCPYGAAKCEITDQYLRFTVDGEYGYTMTIDRASGDYKIVSINDIR